MATERKINTERIKKIANGVQILPTLPTVISKMLQMVDNPRASADMLARIISTDQALTAKLLKQANSAYYGFAGEISTINMAIVVLGFDRVKELGLGMATINIFRNTATAVAGFDPVKFWEHCAACGVAARMLSKNSGARNAGEAFVAGLLHDMGKMILVQDFEPELAEIRKTVTAGEMDTDAAEIEILGVTHGQIGAWLAEKWNLPPIISDTIKHHHDPWNAKIEKDFVAQITVADILCHQTRCGNSGRIDSPKYDDRLWHIFDSAGITVDEYDLDRLQNEFLVEYSKSEAYMTAMLDDMDDGGEPGNPMKNART